MLNRRYLRVKVFHQLYAFFIAPEQDANRAEFALFSSLEKIYELYLSLLLLIVEIKKTAEKHIEQSKKKQLPTHEDIHPSMRFVQNRIIAKICENRRFLHYIEEKKIKWNEEDSFPEIFFRAVRQSSEYADYMTSDENNFQSDKKIILNIFRNHILDNETLQSFLEEKNIHWQDDLTIVGINILKTIENMKENEDDVILIPLYKEESDDKGFAKNLLRKTIQHSKEYEEMIAAKAANWELERIAVADMILMKMALCELMHMDNIPVKVTLNEYIEISKDYSTPQSKIFINGILDKLVVDLKSSGKIVKAGRGLME